ncbi:hypothetical protein J6590_050662 [Homalodisca vitripennis]|nr:hypothetical protein J6590_050662 [Homalodisca vitripennis]
MGEDTVSGGGEEGSIVVELVPRSDQQGADDSPARVHSEEWICVKSGGFNILGRSTIGQSDGDDITVTSCSSSAHRDCDAHTVDAVMPNDICGNVGPAVLPAPTTTDCDAQLMRGVTTPTRSLPIVITLCGSGCETRYGKLGDPTTQPWLACY